jgi:ribose 5-phosphate isomerase A
MDQAAKKQMVAQAALDFVRPGISLGVGTGSTVNAFIDEMERQGATPASLVASSTATEMLLRSAGFTVGPLDGAADIDLYVDGADEANKHFQLIKGGGGALTREKIVAAAARRFVCIIDDSKLVASLGRFPLPVEVIPMAREFVARQFIKMRGQPVWREGFTTDNGNHILDIHHLSIPNPIEMESRINQIPGIVTVGIFAVRPADVLLIADDKGVRRLDRK